jgi:hypothetical protein
MNRPSPRPTALALLLALHGIAILCGPASHRRERHAWPGRGHAGAGWSIASPAGPSHADCPICHALAQDQLAIDRVQIGSCGGIVLGHPGLESREVSSSPSHESRPRAPPLA